MNTSRNNGSGYTVQLLLNILGWGDGEWVDREKTLTINMRKRCVKDLKGNIPWAPKHNDAPATRARGAIEIVIGKGIAG